MEVYLTYLGMFIDKGKELLWYWYFDKCPSVARREIDMLHLTLFIELHSSSFPWYIDITCDWRDGNKWEGDIYDSYDILFYIALSMLYVTE